MILIRGMTKVNMAVVVVAFVAFASAASASVTVNHKPAIARVASAYMKAELGGRKWVVAPGSVKVSSGFAVAVVHPQGSDPYVKVLLAFAGKKDGWYGLRYKDFWTLGCNVPPGVRNALGLRCKVT